MHPPDPLHLCDEAGCEYRGQHYDNCRDCYGWGLIGERPVLGAEVDALRALVGEAYGNPARYLTPCPACGSTVDGAPFQFRRIEDDGRFMLLRPDCGGVFRTGEGDPPTICIEDFPGIPLQPGDVVRVTGLAGGPIEAVAVSRNKRSRGPC